jgi:hypothetical protein
VSEVSADADLLSMTVVGAAGRIGLHAVEARAAISLVDSRLDARAQPSGVAPNMFQAVLESLSMSQ